MKRIISCLISSVLIMVLFAPFVTANEMNGMEDDAMLTDWLKENKFEQIDEILNFSTFDQSMETIDLDSQPMLIIYAAHYPAYAEKRSYEENIQYFKENMPVSIALLSEKPGYIFVHPDTKEASVHSYEVIPTYIKDILGGTVRQMFLGHERKIHNIICFDANTSTKGTVVVYETDGGRYVRFYEHNAASAVEFTWEDYEEKAIAYYTYTTSYEYNYTVDGYTIYGQGTTFLKFVENPNQYIVSDNIGNPKIKWEIVLIVCLCLTICMVLPAVLRKKP